jgi:chromosome segregation protein
MFLKRIEVQGFKSFADKTVLEFEQGVTAIVGPNGSGKSNISDAIRWVMGEMSAKSLRGSSMQDIIFAGTQVRKPVNFAQVSLILDNSDKTFSIDFDEVAVTRRVYRSGESEYQINGSNCRLRDIHELFMDTGIGRDGYSIIGQGNVSQILSTKAEDRRSMFEEAAGISKYKHRKEDAQRKLESVNDNLIRISDITQELETQMKPLGEQSEKARKYLLLRDEYKILDVTMSLHTSDKNRQLIEQTQKQYESVYGELAELKEKEGEFEEKLNRLYQKRKEKDTLQEQCHQQLRENEAKGLTIENEISIAQNNIENNQSMFSRIDREIEIIIKKGQEQHKSVEKLQTHIDSNHAIISSMDRQISGARTENETITSRMNDCKNQIDTMQADLIESMNAVSVSKEKMSGMETLRKNFLDRREVVQDETKSHREGRADMEKDIEQTDSQIKQKREKLIQMQERVQRQEQKKAALEQEIQRIGQRNNALKVEIQSKTSKRRMLEDMENAYEGYAKSVKLILQAPELKKLSIYGTVSGLIEAEADYVTAIEIALGGAMQNIIVESEEDAKEAIAFLKRARAGRATFLPISSVHGRVLDQAKELQSQEGFVGIASDLVKYDRKYDGVVKSLLGRVVVVDTVDHAITISRRFGYRFRVVTLEGEVLNAGGAMSGGSTGRSSGFLSRSNEIKTLTSELSLLHQEIGTVQRDLQKVMESMKNIDIQLSSYVPLVREYEDEILKLESKSAHLHQVISTSGDTEKSLADELAQLEEQITESNDEIALLINAITEKESKTAQLEGEIERLQEQYHTLSQTKEKQAEELMEYTMRLGSIEKDIQMAEEKIQMARQGIEEGKQDIFNRKEDKKKLEEENILLSTQIEEKRKQVEENKRKKVEIEQTIEALGKEKEAIHTQLQSIQDSNKDLTDTLLHLQQELSRVEAKQEKLQNEQETIIARLWDEYELSYTAAMEVRTEVDDEKAAAERIVQLKGQIKALGSINIDAIEEYQSVKERFEFLTNQKADLEKSKDNLNKLITSMQELMEKQFSEQFAVINQSFGEVFRELFGGGKGRLYLSEPNNVLESGIEIEVQLPGKGLQNINLYSGGEKSFIAIALLFAILNVKPTPFCILDEIDAALDDVNVARFATYLKNYFGMTQFVVITHRRGTMEAANLMYGVTMQEKGVSKLLSLHIDDVDDSMVN